MLETKLNDPKVNIEKYKKNKQSLQEGFDSFNRIRNKINQITQTITPTSTPTSTSTSTQICTPVEDDGETEFKDYVISEQPGMLEGETILDTLRMTAVFIFVIIISCIVFPVAAIWAIVKDAEDRGPFRKLMLTVVLVGLFIGGLSTVGAGGKGDTAGKARKLMIGTLLVFTVIFTWISVTGAKMWGMKITDEWDYSKYFSSSDRSFMFYFDVFGVSYDTGQKTGI